MESIVKLYYGFDKNNYNNHAHAGKEMRNSTVTIHNAVKDYLEAISLARSENTTRTYQTAMKFYLDVLDDYNLDPEDSIKVIPVDRTITWMIKSLKSKSAATERLYLTAVNGFFIYLAAEGLAEINLPQIRLLIRQRSRKPGQRLPQFPATSIDAIIEHAINLATQQTDDETNRLINLRDRAFIITLADTGLRVHEICGLRRGDIDWFDGKAVIIGKGDKEAVIRFSSRSIGAIKNYINARASIDGASGKPLSSLPIFSRHDKGAGNRILPITTTTGRKIIKRHAEIVLGKDAAMEISPHSFRHYFVTSVLKGSGGNLKIAQELARHSNISITQRYAHLSDDELDETYYQIFEDK